MKKVNKQLRKSMDSNDSFIDHGHTVVKPRSYKREVPAWVLKDSEIRKLLLRSFPKLATNERQRDAAARWALIIHLYHRMKYTASQIAAELGTTTVRVENVLRSIRRVQRGQSANGSGLIGRKRGRPKKIRA